MVTREAPVAGVRCGALSRFPSDRPARPLGRAEGRTLFLRRKDPGVLLAAEVRHPWPAAPVDLPSRRARPGERAGEGPGHPRLQPPFLLRLDLHTPDGPPQGDVRRESG